MKTYKIGDHVVIDKTNIDFSIGDRYHGKTGIISSIMYHDMITNDYPYLVKIDGYPTLTLWCTVKGYVSNAPKIVVTTDGKITTAKMYENGKVVKTAEAKCCPEDTFDLNVGAKLAVERLTKVEEIPKYYNGKVVCVDNGYCEHCLTVGKIYTFIDGVGKTDNGMDITNGAVKDVADLNSRFTKTKFIEIKE